MKKGIILLAHGEGGRLTRDLVGSLFLSHFGNRYLATLDDGALLPAKDGRFVYTTDSYVVKPLFYPGGDIGMLSVYGTCNDLTVMGAVPKYISCAFVIEEGMELSRLEEIVKSMAKACRVSNVRLVTGDTKVVERGKADSIFITTSGLGFLQDGMRLSPGRIAPGDVVIVSGTLGDHGIAVLAAREELGLTSPVKSDAAPLCLLAEKIFRFGGAIRFMRDPTRGGLATVLCEIAHSAGLSIEVREESIPVRKEVQSICEILGFDPLYVANEGKMVLIVSRKEAGKVLEALRAHPLGRRASVVGEVKRSPAGRVVLLTRAGGRRLIEMLSGEQLPRIC